jgi:plastocyanin
MGPGGMMGSGGMMGIGAGPTAPADTSVRMAGSRFEPSTLTVAVGETVRWFNDDALPHTVSATDGSWDSGNLAPGQAFERRFDTAGTYPYLCRYHPGMTGTIEVSGS